MIPDFKIDGELFDNYAPLTKKALNIRHSILNKISRNPVKNIILNLSDTTVSKEEIEQIFSEFPVEGLNRLWIIDRAGQLHYLLGGKKVE